MDIKTIIVVISGISIVGLVLAMIASQKFRQDMLRGEAGLGFKGLSIQGVTIVGILALFCILTGWVVYVDKPVAPLNGGEDARALQEKIERIETQRDSLNAAMAGKEARIEQLDEAVKELQENGNPDAAVHNQQIQDMLNTIEALNVELAGVRTQTAAARQRAEELAREKESLVREINGYYTVYILAKQNPAISSLRQRLAAQGFKVDYQVDNNITQNRLTHYADEAVRSVRHLKAIIADFPEAVNLRNVEIRKLDSSDRIMHIQLTIADL